ncbi:ComEC family protein [Enterobacteriaceae bacterium H18W14]|uniref:ComEC family protein n=1 Tax=Dryocola boscaweniae TaxID=2925397 RepID=UPI0022F03D5F|nr:ComEC family protein [Dryocola boscaweniae]MCT4714322.1 ComEC family protein [Dryocola boscaweniae]
MVSLPGFCISVIAGILPLLWLSDIPEIPSILLILAAGLCLAVFRFRALRYAAITVICCCWGLFAAKESLMPFERWIQKPVTAQVVITRTDGAQNHELEIIQRGKQYLFPPTGVVLRGVYLPQPVCAGQKWLMTLRLQPVHGQLNEGGFDSQRYALAQHLPFRGRVVEAKILSEQCSLRGGWLNAVTNATQSLTWQGIILALGFGERTVMSAEVKNILRQTGTAHLMAISGLHISLAAGVGWLFARALQFFLPAHRIHYRMPLLASLFTAGVCTWLAGCNPPAARTFLGLIIWLSLRLSGRQWSNWEVWVCCIAGILLYDPLTVLSDSFWLSVLAVAAIIFWYQWVPLPRRVMKWRWFYRHLAGLVYLQAGITLLLLPLQVFIFHGLSLNALLANLLAVPFVSFIVTPLLFAGLVLTGIPWLGEYLWRLVDALLEALFIFLKYLPGGWQELDDRFQAIGFIGWLGIGIYRLSLWRTSPASIGALTVVLIVFSLRTPERKEWKITMLDVGHGLAVVIARHGKVLLYDTGNAWPGGDAAQRIIIPWLRWHNLTPEAVIISHEHLDHRGGLSSLQQAWPGITVRSPLRWANHLPCFRGQKWQWQGLNFTAYWPPAEQRAQGNNGSCVVMVSDGRFRLLLTGDMEAPAELSLLKRQWGALEADIVQVPHHGSRTSSSAPLLRAISGKAALASVSRYNAWRLPSAKVIERYKKQGYTWYDTAHSGQITIRVKSDKWQINGFREQIMPRWYHQWFGVTKDNR